MQLLVSVELTGLGPKNRIQLYFTDKTMARKALGISRAQATFLSEVSPDSNPKTSKYVTRPYVMIRYAEIL
ncbi:hypothetical protein KGMB02408_25080 [Bacteroides faecalis]|uniref:Uncharacterized protein n=1 Tax=Bacteroides faecalis TaxID=2447885 RepID=A0A401LVL0_9BACE|nr:hypothetical protein KGMB02408_25080 [Bacteroides faecalis]